MEENFSMEWNMEKNFSMEWKWNGKKLPVWNMEKLSSIPFHTMPWWVRGRVVRAVSYRPRRCGFEPAVVQR